MAWFEKILDVWSSIYFCSFWKEVVFILVLELAKRTNQENKAIKLLYIVGMGVHCRMGIWDDETIKSKLNQTNTSKWVYIHKKIVSL